jgi:hypothetical protein
MTPPAASAPESAMTPQGEEEPAAKVEETSMPPAVVEPRPASVPGPELEPEPVGSSAKGAPAGQPDGDGPLPGGEPEDEDGEEPDPEPDTLPDDEGDEEPRERLSIEFDLSVLPANLTQRQRAERIYVAHQAAGVALSQTDLGKWAGYKNANSGGNEYRRLEKAHGPILVRKGATHIEEQADAHPAVTA